MKSFIQWPSPPGQKPRLCIKLLLIIV